MEVDIALYLGDIKCQTHRNNVVNMAGEGREGNRGEGANIVIIGPSKEGTTGGVEFGVGGVVGGIDAKPEVEGDLDGVLMDVFITVEIGGDHQGSTANINISAGRPEPP